MSDMLVKKLVAKLRARADRASSASDTFRGIDFECRERHGYLALVLREEADELLKEVQKAEAREAFMQRCLDAGDLPPCLSCGRVVLSGRCCDTPLFPEPRPPVLAELLTRCEKAESECNEALPSLYTEPTRWQKMLAWFREIIGKWKNRKCSARNAHAWVISRQWDLRTASSNLHYVGFPRAMGADAKCQDCGAELLTFQRTGDVLRACRYLKGGDVERATSLRLKRDIEPLLTACRSADVWLAGQTEHHDVHDVFDVKYVFDGQPIPEEYDDADHPFYDARGHRALLGAG